jgi:hypothetical protein
MATTPWTIGIISTGYDMRDLRATLATMLSDEMGFRVLAYERPSFPVEPGVHSHEACVQAFHQADIMILIIDKRYGGLYLGYGDLSVTVQEYRTAVQRGKILIPCVRSESWQDRHSCFSILRELEQKGVVDPRSQISPTYVDKWAVLDFIEEVRKADKDNFVIIFRDATNLQSQLKGRLRGLSRHLISKIVERQGRLVKDTRTTTGMAFSLGDVLSKGYFLEPPYVVKSGDTGSEEKITALTARFQAEDCCIAILGQPGSGKSTLLGKTFLDHAQQSLEDGSNRLPFYVSLRGRGVNFSFSFIEYVNNCFATLFEKQMYPQIELTHVKPVFYMDGFDELSEDIGKLDLRRLYDSDMFRHPFILCCRSRFAAEHLNEVTLGSRLSLVVELQPWDEATTQRYIREFCRLQNREELAAETEKVFQEQPGMEEISTNPLLLTLFLWVVQESEMSLPLDVRGKRTLFDKCLQMWAKRELARLGMNGTPDGRLTAKSVLQGWELGAWEIYRSRFRSIGVLTMPEMLRKIANTRPELETICEREMFLGLFEIRPYSDQVTGMLHEQLLEHLTARAIVRGMQENIYPFPGSLAHAIRYEINRIVRSIWGEAPSSELQNTLQHLWDAYTNALGGDSATSTMQRNQSTYYIGRLGLPDAVDYLRKADKIENNLFVKLSIGFGLIKLCQFDVEEELYTKLVENGKWDIGNRGYHLVYYGDWQPEESPPYKDPGSVSWDNTMSALLRHIESPAARHVAIRRVELLTIRRFIETRGNPGPLDEETLHRIERAIRGFKGNSECGIPEEFYKQVEVEYGELRKAWERVRGYRA